MEGHPWEKQHRPSSRHKPATRRRDPLLDGDEPKQTGTKHINPYTVTNPITEGQPAGRPHGLKMFPPRPMPLERTQGKKQVEHRGSPGTSERLVSNGKRLLVGKPNYNILTGQGDRRTLMPAKIKVADKLLLNSGKNVKRRGTNSNARWN